MSESMDNLARLTTEMGEENQIVKQVAESVDEKLVAAKALIKAAQDTLATSIANNDSKDKLIVALKSQLSTSVDDLKTAVDKISEMTEVRDEMLERDYGVPSDFVFGVQKSKEDGFCELWVLYKTEWNKTKAITFQYPYGFEDCTPTGINIEETVDGCSYVAGTIDDIRAAMIAGGIEERPEIIEEVNSR